MRQLWKFCFSGEAIFLGIRPMGSTGNQPIGNHFAIYIGRFMFFFFFPLLSVAPSAEEKVNGPQNGLAHPPDAFLPPSLLMLSVLNFNLIWKKKNLIWFIIPPRDGVASWASEISEILKIRHRTFDGLGQTLIFWRQNTRIDIKHFVHCWRITTNQRSGNFRLKRGKSAAINGVQVP